MNKEKTNIILCGFMASGKTSVAKALSKELGYPYIDTDELIVKESKMSIPEIFDKYGEDYFRDLEFDTANKLKDFNNTIISTGGGMLTFDRNVEVLKEVGTIIHIKREFDDIYQSLLKDKTRPLAQQKTKEELKCVTKEEVLNHPVWKMGPSITVNSANLSNKAMEVFEARILFQKYTSDISVKIEKNGIIHGMIVLPSGDIYKHVSTPLMSEFIKDGLNQALDLGYDFFHVEPMKKEEFLSLAEPSLDRYPLFKLASVNHNPLFPLVYTAVIEGLTEVFLEDKIEFLDIEENAVKLIGKFPLNLTLSIKQKIDYYEEIKNQVKKEFSK